LLGKKGYVISKGKKGGDGARGSGLQHKGMKNKTKKYEREFNQNIDCFAIFFSFIFALSE